MLKYNSSTPSSVNQLPEAIGTIARQAENAAKEVADRATVISDDLADAAKNATEEVTETAKDMYHTVTMKAEEALTTSQEYVRRHPLPVVFGAIALGAAVGYLLLRARSKPSLRERYADEPLDALRNAIISVISPMTQGIHKGFDSARDGAGIALGQVQRFGSRHKSDSFSDRLGRVGDKIKFW